MRSHLEQTWAAGSNGGHSGGAECASTPTAASSVHRESAPFGRGAPVLIAQRAKRLLVKSVSARDSSSGVQLHELGGNQVPSQLLPVARLAARATGKADSCQQTIAMMRLLLEQLEAAHQARRPPRGLGFRV